MADCGEEAGSDAFFERVTRQIQTVLGAFRSCPTPSCRRSRSCRGSGFRCIRDHPQEPITEAARQEVLFEWKQSIAKVRAEWRAEGEAGPAAGRGARPRA